MGQLKQLGADLIMPLLNHGQIDIKLQAAIDLAQPYDAPLCDELLIVPYGQQFRAVSG